MPCRRQYWPARRPLDACGMRRALRQFATLSFPAAPGLGGPEPTFMGSLSTDRETAGIGCLGQSALPAKGANARCTYAPATGIDVTLFSSRRASGYADHDPASADAQENPEFGG